MGVYPSLMPATARIRDGFRAIFRASALILAEIVWRWAFSAAAWVLVIFAVAEYLDSLYVSTANHLLLISGNPLLVAQAIGNIFHGSGARLLRAAAILIPALAILWAFAAALGRSATLGVLLRVPHTSAGDVGTSRHRAQFRSLLGLTFLRAALLLATTLALIGAAILTSIIVPPQAQIELSEAAGQAPGEAIALFFILCLLTVYISGVIYWLLSIAPIFAVRDGRSPLGSLAGALAAIQAHKGEFIGVSSFFGLLRLTAAVAASFAVLLALGLIGHAAGAAASGATFAAIAVIFLIYAAAVDFLYIARLAAYVAIVDQPEAPPAQLATPDIDAPPCAPLPAGTD